jgi:hypothetical protein
VYDYEHGCGYDDVSHTRSTSVGVCGVGMA